MRWPLCTAVALAAWCGSAAGQIPLAVGPGAPSQLTVATRDSIALLVWRDDRTLASGYDIYAQALDRFGNPRWGAFGSGVAICAAAEHQDEPAAAVGPDGVSWIAWRDGRECGGAPRARIFQQALAPNGTIQCTANGRLVHDDCRTLGSHHPSVIASEAGSSIVTWNYKPPAGFGFHDSRIRSQRQSSSCSGVWSSDAWNAPWTGTPDMPPRTISDGAGGLIAAWADSEPCAPYIYVRRTNSGGTPLWSDQITICSNVKPDPARVCTDNASVQRNPQIAPDGAGGIIVVWEHGPDGARSIRAQRIDASGVRQWGTCGKLVAATAGDLRNPQIVRSSSGRSFVSWEDVTTATEANLYAQRINLLGDTLAPRIPVATAPLAQSNHRLAAGPSGSAFLAWEDARNLGEGDLGDIYLQRIDAAGILACAPGGVRLPAPAETRQSEPRLAAFASQFGTMLLAWTDDRNGDPDLYGWFLEDACDLAVLAVPREFHELSLRAHPNPLRDRTTITFTTEASVRVSVAIFDLAGRQIRSLFDGQLETGTHRVAFDGRDEAGLRVQPGVYFARVVTGGRAHQERLVVLR